MVSYSDDEDMESRIQLLVSNVLSDSGGEETLRDSFQLDDVEPEDETELRSVLVESGHTQDGAGEGSNKEEPKEKRADKLEAKECQLQTSRQMWAVFDAIGPAKAPSKCDRPFVGRQQELYEECLVLTAANHKEELKMAGLRENFDNNMAAIEALFILKGLSKFKKGSKEVGPLPNELTIMHSWFVEFKAFMTMRNAYLRKKVENPSLEKVFKMDDLCVATDYISGEGTEALSFTTRRRGNTYDISITLNVDYLDLSVERQEQDPKIQLSTDALTGLVKTAAKKRLGAQELVRLLFWPYTEKAEEAICQKASNNAG